MARFLTTNGTSFNIENIIIGAKKKLVLVSPYLQISKTFFERLKDASNKGVEIKIIYGKDDLKPNQRNSLAELRNVQLYYFDNLHAKCYFNEREMVITSMNMYEFSEKTNREMGVLISRSEDEELFLDAVNETHSIIQSSELIQLSRARRNIDGRRNTDQSRVEINGRAHPKRGYCIRCEERIGYDVSRPYCRECYSIWAQYQNADYIENVCHACGEFGQFTIGRPLCYECFVEYEK